MAKAGSFSERSLVARLKTAQIDAIFRRTEEGRIYGATFVDHNTRTVLNGSALGKDYSARAWDEWLKNLQPDAQQTAQPYGPDKIPEYGQSPASEQIDGSREKASLIEQTLLEGLDVFGTLFEVEQPPYEYIDPAFRLIRRKKRKKKRSPKF